jgi:hypothetical protein
MKKNELRMELKNILNVKAITFDEFFTLRYPIEEKEDIIYPILKALKREGISVDYEEFLKHLLTFSFFLGIQPIFA